MKPIDGDDMLRRVNFLLATIYTPEFVEILTALKEAPTLTLDDLRPKGRWVGIGYEGYADGTPVYDYWECSECGEEVEGEDVPETHPFCHGCGADMRGGGEDG